MSDIVYGDYDDDDLEEWRMGISANGLRGFEAGKRRIESRFL